MNDPLDEQLARLRAATESLEPRAGFAARVTEGLVVHDRWTLLVRSGRRFAVGAFAVAALVIGVSEIADDSSTSALDVNLAFDFDVETPW